MADLSNRLRRSGPRRGRRGLRVRVALTSRADPVLRLLNCWARMRPREPDRHCNAGRRGGTLRGCLLSAPGAKPGTHSIDKEDGLDRPQNHLYADPGALRSRKGLHQARDRRSAQDRCEAVRAWGGSRGSLWNVHGLSLSRGAPPDPAVLGTPGRQLSEFHSIHLGFGARRGGGIHRLAKAEAVVKW